MYILFQGVFLLGELVNLLAPSLPRLLEGTCLCLDLVIPLSLLLLELGNLLLRLLNLLLVRSNGSGGDRPVLRRPILLPQRAPDEGAAPERPERCPVMVLSEASW